MDCFNPISLPDRGLVPCGKCLACLKRRQDDWCFRLEQEYKNSINCYFITLTYAETNVPTFGSTRVLRKRDFQLFLKRLRKRISPCRIRYFACGEYGSVTKRPHYHAIIFNFPSSFDVFQCIEASWMLGYTLVKPINSNHFRYVAKYCVTTSTLPAVLRRKEFRPFTLSSRRPAIGRCYLTDNMVNYHRETLSTVSLCNGMRYATPKYYKDRIFDDSMKADIRDRVDDYRLRQLEFDDYFNQDIQYSLDQADMRLQKQADFARRYYKSLNKSSKI